METYTELVAMFGKCLASENVNGLFYGLALDGAIGRLRRIYPEISESEIVDDLIKARRLETAKNKETDNA